MCGIYGKTLGMAMAALWVVFTPTQPIPPIRLLPTQHCHTRRQRTRSCGHSLRSLLARVACTRSTDERAPNGGARQ